MIEGKRLGQPLADEIKRIIYAPRLASERTDCFAQLSAVNMAHLLMLAQAAEKSQAHNSIPALAAGNMSPRAHEVFMRPAREMTIRTCAR